MPIPRPRLLIAAALLTFSPPLFAQTCTETSWRPADPAPPARLGAAMVFDAARERLVMFGGLHWSSSTRLPANDTWDWDGNLAQWQRRFPTSKPSPRDSHAMVYDPVRQKVVLFGGANLQGQELGDTWEFDCVAGQWQQRFPSTSPGHRQGAAMFFDPTSQTILMFGGYLRLSTVANHLWQWNDELNSWTQRPHVNPPSTRSFAAVVPEPGTETFLLFGGLDPTATISNNETWRFEASSSTWTELEPPQRPSRRAAHALAPDPSSGRIVLFGGAAYEGHGPTADTWEWNPASNNWIERDPSTAPTRRYYTAAAFDTRRGSPILYGGYNEVKSLGDMWEWNSASGEWSLVHQPLGPETGAIHSLSYDSSRRRVVALSSSDWALNGAMWEWDGLSWHEIVSPATIPSIAPLAFDGTRTITVFPVGSGTQTWGWDGVAWIRLADCPAVNPGFVALAFDAARARTVLFAGDSRETWEWNGSTWNFRQFGGPVRRSRFVMTFDSAHNETILHGGEGTPTPTGIPLFNDTWTWNGSSWHNITSGTVPAIEVALAFDPNRRVLVLVGHSGVYERTRQTPWVAVPPPGHIQRRLAVMVHHDAAKQLFLLGGSTLGSSLTLDDIFTLTRGCSCYANCDNSTTAPRLTANDFTCFLSRFAAADPAANCDSSTGTPALTPADFLCFISHFAAGCP